MKKMHKFPSFCRLSGQVQGRHPPLNTDPSKTDSPEGQNLDPALPFRGIPIRKKILSDIAKGPLCFQSRILAGCQFRKSPDTRR